MTTTQLSTIDLQMKHAGTTLLTLEQGTVQLTGKVSLFGQSLITHAQNDPGLFLSELGAGDVVAVDNGGTDIVVTVVSVQSNISATIQESFNSMITVKDAFKRTFDIKFKNSTPFLNVTLSSVRMSLSNASVYGDSLNASDITGSMAYSNFIPLAQSFEELDDVNIVTGTSPITGSPIYGELTLATLNSAFVSSYDSANHKNTELSSEAVMDLLNSSLYGLTTNASWRLEVDVPGGSDALEYFFPGDHKGHFELIKKYGNRMPLFFLSKDGGVYYSHFRETTDERFTTWCLLNNEGAGFDKAHTGSVLKEYRFPRYGFGSFNVLFWIDGSNMITCSGTWTVDNTEILMHTDHYLHRGAANYQLIMNQFQQRAPGTVTLIAGSKMINGTGTSFLGTISNDDFVNIDNEIFQVHTVESFTRFFVKTAPKTSKTDVPWWTWGQSTAGGGVGRRRMYFKILTKDDSDMSTVDYHFQITIRDEAPRSLYYHYTS